MRSLSGSLSLFVRKAVVGIVRDQRNGGLVGDRSSAREAKMRRSTGEPSTKRTALLAAVAFASIDAALTGASAQNVPADGETRAREERSDEIIVTARRREETLQDVPVSMTAFTNKALENRGITNLETINNFTPNLELTNGRPDGGGSTAQIYIRGVGQSDFLFPNDPGVGLYVDDVYLARSVGGMLGLVDVDRVEVLRGPQGTLYGKNTIGGAVKIVTTKPQIGEFSGKLKATYGSFDRFDFVGAVNIPLGKTLAARLEAAKFERDGYVTRLFDGADLGNEDKEIIRADLFFQPHENFTLRLTGDVQSQRQNGAPGNLLAIVPSTAAAVPIPGVIDPVTNQQDFVDGTGLIEGLYNPVVVPVIAPGLGLPVNTAFDSRWLTDDSRLSNGTDPVRDDNDIWGMSLTGDWAVSENLNVKSISAYRKVQATLGRDGDHSPLPIVSTYDFFEQEQFSEELQLSGQSIGDRLNWLVGAHYFHEEAADNNSVKLISGTLQVIGFELDLIPKNQIEVNSYAAFVNGDFDITDRLSVTGGVRYTYEKKVLQRDHRLTQTGFIITRREEGLPDMGEFSPIGPPLEQDWDAFSPKAGVNFEASDDVLLYFSYARGFKSGGWSPRPQTGTENVPFDQEFLGSLEVGAKTQFFGQRMTANFSAFYNTYKDIQITTVGTDPGGSGQLVFSVFNAGESEIYGFELEVAAQPTDNIDLNVGIGYLHNEYTELDPGTGIQPDASLPDAPELTFNASGQYTVPLMSLGEVSVRGGVAYKDKTFKDAFNTQPLTQDGYWLVDASLAFETNDGSWRVALVGSNLTDEVYITNGVNAEAFGYFEGYYGRPREIALTLTHRF